jgi:hypothetical protein
MHAIIYRVIFYVTYGTNRRENNHENYKDLNDVV